MNNLSFVDQGVEKAKTQSLCLYPHIDLDELDYLKYNNYNLF